MFKIGAICMFGAAPAPSNLGFIRVMIRATGVAGRVCQGKGLPPALLGAGRLPLPPTCSTYKGPTSRSCSQSSRDQCMYVFLGCNMHGL